MPDMLGELVEKITVDAAGLKQGLSQADTAMEKSAKTVKDRVEDIKKAINSISTAWAGVGAAIVGGMGLMAKAAADEEVNINRLSITLKNVGVSYNDVKDSLEAVISATQRKTGIADSEQRDTLNRLLLTTGDYATSLKLLPTVLDLAAAGEMDVTTAATYLGKAHNELAAGADKVSVRFGQASLQFKSMADIEARVAGAAEACANPFNVLKAEIGDTAEAIGAVMLPYLKEMVDKFVKIVDVVKKWVDANPELVKAIMAGSIAVAALITGVFALKAAIMLLGTTANLQFGGILILIGALVTAGVWMWQNWDKVSHFFADAWSNIKNATLHAVEWILKALDTLLGWVPGIGDFFEKAGEKISGMIDAERLSRDARDVQRDLDNLAETAVGATTTTDKLTTSEGELSGALEDTAVSSLIAAEGMDILTQSAAEHGREIARLTDAYVENLKILEEWEKLQVTNKAAKVTNLTNSLQALAEQMGLGNFFDMINNPNPNDPWQVSVSKAYQELLAATGGVNPSSYGRGGIVPGPIGQPQLAVVHGGEEYAGVGGKIGATIINHYHIAGSVIAERQLTDIVQKGLYNKGRKDYTSGV